MREESHSESTPPTPLAHFGVPLKTSTSILVQGNTPLPHECLVSKRPSEWWRSGTVTVLRHWWGATAQSQQSCSWKASRSRWRWSGPGCFPRPATQKLLWRRTGGSRWSRHHPAAPSPVGGGGSMNMDMGHMTFCRNGLFSLELNDLRGLRRLPWCWLSAAPRPPWGRTRSGSCLSPAGCQRCLPGERSAGRWGGCSARTLPAGSRRAACRAPQRCLQEQPAGPKSCCRLDPDKPRSARSPDTESGGRQQKENEGFHHGWGQRSTPAWLHTHTPLWRGWSHCSTFHSDKWWSVTV